MSTQTTQRLMAMVKQCRAKGCGCGVGQCKAIVELSRELGRLDGERKIIADQITKCQTPPATVKPDWIRPESPGGDYELVAYHDVDEFYLMWVSDTEDVMHVDEWPFVQNYVYPDDFERIGIRVEQ